MPSRRAAVLVLLVLPIPLVLLNPSWLFTTALTIDPWVYFGYFLNLDLFKGVLFPHTYYGSRLSWIVPGSWVYAVAEPLVANYILRFSLFYASTFCLFSILESTIGRRIALLTTILFATHIPFLLAIGWDYVDGPGIAYNLLALALASHAARSRHRRSLLLGAGMAAAAMAYCNIFLICFLPFIPLTYLFCRSKHSPTSSLADLLRDVIWLALGAAILSLFLGIINYRLDGNLWFYQPSVNTALQLTSEPNPWAKGGLSWIKDAFWLGLPAIIALCGILYLVQAGMRGALSWRDPRCLHILYLLSAITLYVLCDLKGGIMLQLYYYTSYLLPPLFLALGSLLPVSIDNWTSRQYWLVLCSIGAAFAWTQRFRPEHLTYYLGSLGLPSVVIIISLLIGIAVVAAGRLHTWSLIFGALWCFQVTYYVPSLGAPQIPYHDRFQRIVKGTLSVKDFLASEHSRPPLRFWYHAREDPYGPEFHAVSSAYLWLYTLAGNEFPALMSQDSIAPGMTVVGISGRDDFLKTMISTLRERHFAPAVLRQETISHGNGSYKMYFVRVDAAEEPAAAP